MGCLCGVTPSTVWLSLVHTPTERPARQVLVWQWRSAETEAVHTGVYSPNVSALHRSRHSPSLPFFTDSRFVLGRCHVFFYGIVMAKCIFLMSCIAEETVPVGHWRCLFFLMCMSFGTTSYNDFLLPLFKPCLKLEGVQYSGLGRENLLDYI